MIIDTPASDIILVRILLVALPISFAIGALTHAGVRLPLGVATIDEPTIVPAAVVEAIIAAAFAFAAFAEFAGRPYAREWRCASRCASASRACCSACSRSHSGEARGPS